MYKTAVGAIGGKQKSRYNEKKSIKYNILILSPRNNIIKEKQKVQNVIK